MSLNNKTFCLACSRNQPELQLFQLSIGNIYPGVLFVSCFMP